MEEARCGGLARLILLLHLEHGARLGKRWQRPEHGDQGRLLGEAVVEATHERMKEGAVGNHLAELSQLVADGFDALAENADRAITLSDGAELRVERGDASVAVVLKQPAELEPDVARGGTIRDDEVEELRRDARVEPLNNGEVVFDPCGITRSRRDIIGDVTKEGASPKMDFNKMTPVVVIVAMKIEDDGD